MNALASHPDTAFAGALPSRIPVSEAHLLMIDESGGFHDVRVGKVAFFGQEGDAIF